MLKLNLKIKFCKICLKISKKFSKELNIWQFKLQKFSKINIIISKISKKNYQIFTLSAKKVLFKSYTI